MIFDIATKCENETPKWWKESESVVIFSLFRLSIFFLFWLCYVCTNTNPKPTNKDHKTTATLQPRTPAQTPHISMFCVRLNNTPLHRPPSSQPVGEVLQHQHIHKNTTTNTCIQEPPDSKRDNTICPHCSCSFSLSLSLYSLIILASKSSWRTVGLNIQFSNCFDFDTKAHP